MSTATINEIISFWLGPSLESPDQAFTRRKWWYEGGPAVDTEIRSQFGELVSLACMRKLMEWQSTPDGAFALVLLLDQFTRNIYRGTPQAYAGDETAFAVVSQAIERGLDQALHPVSRIWLYHPFHHAERIEDQDRGMELLHAIKQAAPALWHPYIERSIKGWTRHRDIVARFGRFPHRNAILKRVSTDAETAFLAEGAESFRQDAR